jgi:hypothetical protein
MFRFDTGMSVQEFDAFVAIIRPEFIKPRDPRQKYTWDENNLRRNQPHLRRLSPEQEIYMCLWWHRCYPTDGFRHAENYSGLSKTQLEVRRQ